MDSPRPPRANFSAPDHPLRIQRLYPDISTEVQPDWATCTTRMRDYDEAMVRGWKEEIDTLLVFAGLFSAVVTAFNIEAYHLLQEDPNETSVQILQQISRQISAPAPGCESHLSTPAGNPIFRPTSQSIRINALWFSSLIFSLFSALVAIMAKQWLREYLTVASLSSREAVRLRQYRYNCLVSWYIPEIMTLLPLLLQLSLILFFVGLIDFLFTLHVVVAGIVTALIVVALLFYVVTTIAPVFHTSCPFKSPQSWLLVRAKEHLIAIVSRYAAFTATARFRCPQNPEAVQPKCSSWSERDRVVVQRQQETLDLKALVWVHSSFTDDNTQDSMTAFIAELSPDNASLLAFTILAAHLHIPPLSLVTQVRSRACSALLQDAGAHLPKPARKRCVYMLLRLLEHLPRDHDPQQLGVLDVLWTLWEIFVGACSEDPRVPIFYTAVLKSVARLLGEHEPFRLRRAALNLLWETTHQRVYLYSPSAVGDVISFARACLHEYQHPSLFLKSCALALLLYTSDNSSFLSQPRSHRSALRIILHALTRVLRDANNNGTPLDPHCTACIAQGLSAVMERDPEIVEAELPAVLVESVQIGQVDVGFGERPGPALVDLAKAQCARKDELCEGT
ncbi:hypothetical protein C8Q78DRAFT_1167965 [Trametes maxima]|nr:hypothetical protein C8Q78DRAFT_1167965 [Trametes maxima]